MKTIHSYHPVILVLIAILLSFSAQSTAAQTSSPYYYYAQGERVLLTLNPSRIAVRFQPNVSEVTRRVVTQQTDEIESFDSRVEEKPLALTLLSVRTSRDPFSAIYKLKSRAEVQTAGAVFQFSDSTQYIETDEFIARFKPNLSPVAIAMFNLAHGVEFVRAQDYSQRVLILRPLPNNLRSARDLANAYFESGWVEFAEPNFVIIRPQARETQVMAAPKASVIPNDINFSQQWALQNTGQFQGSIVGADIKATQAWDVTKGASQIKIAIIDEGADATHPDLQGKVLPGINVTVQPNNTNTQPSNSDYHGTATAAIAAAKTNNVEGIAGVCWYCQILPVKVAYENAQGGWVTSTAQLAAGIDWAWQNGADVLSNSWTMSAPSDAVRQAIINAYTGGRGGWGSTLVFASGNENSNTVSFPAQLKNVIAVGASNWCDQRKTKTNDGCNYRDTSWGSNYGSALDLLAPGEAIYTACKGGGYCYVSGTSAATPIVAGAIGLLYSLNPNLDPQSIQAALQNGAKDIAPAGRDDNSGYGRVDAYRAIAALYDTSVQMRHSNSLLHPGDTVQYALNYSNIGMTDMGSTMIAVTLPSGLSYVNSNPNFVAQSNGVYQLNLSTLSRNQSGVAMLTAQVQLGTGGQTLSANTQIGGAFPELNMSNNVINDSITIIATDNFLPFITR